MPACDIIVEDATCMTVLCQQELSQAITGLFLRLACLHLSYCYLCLSMS